MTSDATVTVPYRSVLGVRAFAALFVAHVVSMVGDVVAAVALTVLVYDRTGSPLLSAITFSLVFVPQLIGLVAIPRIVGRFDPRRTLICCHLASAVLVGTMAVPGAPVFVLLLLLTLLGLIAPVFTGMRASLLPELLPDPGRLVLGRSLLRMASQASQVVGNLCGGLLLLAVPPAGALAIDAATFLVSALLIGRAVPGPARSEAADPPVTRRPSLRAAWRLRPLRRMLLLSWSLPACLVAPEALAATYVDTIGVTAGAVGLVLAAVSIGAVVAQALGARLTSAGTRMRLLVPCALVGCVPLIAFLARPTLLPAVVLLLVCGLGSLAFVAIDDVVVRLVDGPLLGTVLALQAPAMMCAQGVAFAVWGALGELASAPVVIAVAGASGLLSVAACAPWRSAEPHSGMAKTT